MTKNGYGDLVVMSIEAYERLISIKIFGITYSGMGKFNYNIIRELLSVCQTGDRENELWNLL